MNLEMPVFKTPQNALTQNYVLLGFWANEENSVFHTQIMQNGQKKQG